MYTYITDCYIGIYIVINTDYKVLEIKSIIQKHDSINNDANYCAYSILYGMSISNKLSVSHNFKCLLNH